MHFNYFFLAKLARQLNKRLSGARILEVFSQNKNELIISCLPSQEKKIFHFRINLSPNFAFINFPDEFYRSKRNSINLFAEIFESFITSIYEIENDRSIVLQLSNSFLLLLKLHGNQSNILLLKDKEVHSIFRKKIIKDNNLQLDDLNKKIDYSEQKFYELAANLQEYPTLGPLVKNHLRIKWAESRGLEEKWISFKKIMDELLDDNIYLTRIEGKITLSLIQTGEVVSTFHDPMQALNEFTGIFLRENDFIFKKNHAENLLRHEEKLLVQSLQSLETTIQKLEHQKNYKLFADLLMANLNQVKPFETEVILKSFEGDSMVTIPLKKGLSPQKNAENYYRKSKNQNIQIAKSQELKRSKEEALVEIRSSMKLLQESKTIKEIEEIIAPFEKLKADKSRNLPYKVYKFMDFEIRVGKNAKSNDLNTFKHSHKDDLWLHVKDSGGSHVIIKHQSGLNFPKPVIERAAQLAAFHSKRKNESLCPVIYTSKKFVRKRKGDPAGVVVVEKERTILAEPKS